MNRSRTLAGTSLVLASTLTLFPGCSGATPEVDNAEVIKSEPPKPAAPAAPPEAPPATEVPKG